jgi:N-acetyl sugar amidotransferase
MDETAEEFVLFETGFCNFCTDFLQKTENVKNLQGPYFSNEQRNRLIKQVKKSGLKGNYDCIVGVSGGVDSSYVLHCCLEAGLRPLAVHMDNGWDAEAAQFNIEVMLRNTSTDLVTYVIDWEVYRDMMQKFFDRDVVDVELLYDNAAIAVLYYYANKFNIKYIFSGANQATEGVKVPNNWNWFKLDKRNILSITRGVKLKNYPIIGIYSYLYYNRICKIKTINYLDYLEYNKEEALTLLETNYGYKRYLYKHYESVFTRLYQGYLLPRKFQIDKRKVHLSTLVLTNQLTRNEAIEHLNYNPYASDDLLMKDIKFFQSKMGWSHEKLQDYLRRGEVSHAEFSSDKKNYERIIETNKIWKRIKKYAGFKTKISG